MSNIKTNNKKNHPFGDGRTSKKILFHIKNFTKKNNIKEFYDIDF